MVGILLLIYLKKPILVTFSDKRYFGFPKQVFQTLYFLASQY